MDYTLFFDLALIIFAAKMLGLLMHKIHIPQVVGEILAGFFIGPNLLGLVDKSDFITYMSELGVIMLMFVAGLETDLKEIKRSGAVSAFVAAMGVLFPLLLGYLLYSLMYGFAPLGTPKFLEAAFTGTIITATSVGITVEVLREMGRLKGRVGTVILSAAIIDDVIGIVLLTVVTGMKDTAVNPVTVLLKTALFLVFCLGAGFLVYRLFRFLDAKYPHRRRVPIFSFAFCLFMAYIAEHFFGIADITGAYVAGVIFCNIKDADYIARRVDISSYMIFSPVFFAGIGIKITLRGMDSAMLLFAVLFVLTALIAKVLGCGLAAKISGFSVRDSLRVGVGMMARGEVALIVAQKGVNAGILPEKYFAAVILLIMTSSVVTPVLLRLLFREKKKPGPGALTGESENSEMLAE